MPNRWLKADILTSERFNGASLAAQAVFVRLLVVVDDHARYDGRITLLLSACDPLQTFARNCEQVSADSTQKWFAGMLAELEAADLLRFWTSEKGAMLLIPRFYERPRSKSKFPEPPEELLTEQGCTHLLADVCRCALSTSTSTTSTTVHDHGTRHTNTSPAKARAARPAKKSETDLPQNFAISDAVRAWAAEKGHTNLDAHLESFVGKAKAKGYRYIDWDQALQNAIREDWAGLKSNGRNGGGQSVADHNARARAEFLSKQEKPIEGDRVESQ